LSFHPFERLQGEFFPPPPPPKAINSPSCFFLRLHFVFLEPCLPPPCPKCLPFLPTSNIVLFPTTAHPFSNRALRMLSFPRIDAFSSFPRAFQHPLPQDHFLYYPPSPPPDPFCPLLFVGFVFPSSSLFSVKPFVFFFLCPPFHSQFFTPTRPLKRGICLFPLPPLFSPPSSPLWVSLQFLSAKICFHTIPPRSF